MVMSMDYGYKYGSDYGYEYVLDMDIVRKCIWIMDLYGYGFIWIRIADTTDENG